MSRYDPHLPDGHDYNQWMNAKVYAAAASLPPEELRAGGALFSALLGA